MTEIKACLGCGRRAWTVGGDYDYWCPNCERRKKTMNLTDLTSSSLVTWNGSTYRVGHITGFKLGDGRLMTVNLSGHTDEQLRCHAEVTLQFYVPDGAIAEIDCLLPVPSEG